MNKFEVDFKNRTGIEFKKFYKENKPKLVWYITKWTKSIEAAEDFAEEAFIQALKKIDLYQGDKSQAHTWLYSIANNIVKKSYADQQKLPSVSIDKVFNDNANVKMFLPYEDNKKEIEHYQETCKKAEIIKNAIYSLPDKYEKYKKVLIMRQLENFSYDEISEYLGLNLSTVKSQIRKGRQIIKKKVENQINIIDEQGLY